MNDQELIRKTSGCHVLIYAGDGHNRPAELLFSTGNGDESNAICRLLLRAVGRDNKRLFVALLREKFDEAVHEIMHNKSFSHSFSKKDPTFKLELTVTVPEFNNIFLQNELDNKCKRIKRLEKRLSELQAGNDLPPPEDPNLCPWCKTYDCAYVVAGADCPALLALQEDYEEREAQQ